MSTPTCPTCGGHSFSISVYQTIYVEFEADDIHNVYEGPTGDMEWDGNSFAVCTGCGHSAVLKEMK